MPGKMRRVSGEQDFLRKNRKFFSPGIAQRNAEKFFYYN